VVEVQRHAFLTSALDVGEWSASRLQGYGLEEGGFESRQGLGIFLFITASRPALGQFNLLSNGYQWLFPGCEADHSPPSSAEVKNAWRCTSTTYTPEWCGA
jgi:hypothetical protein